MNRGLANRDRNSSDLGETARSERPPLDATDLFAAYRKSRSSDLAARVYDLTATRLRIYAATLVSDPNDVDDAVQEAFVTAFERPETWNRDLPLLPWLAGIVRNRILNRNRAERRRRERESRQDDSATPRIDPLQQMGAAEVFRAVEDGIAGLPTTYRRVVANRLLDGASSAEIARQLGRAENTVRVQLKRGLRMLRDALPLGIGAALAATMLPTGAVCASPTGGLGQQLGQAVHRAARRRRLVRAALLSAAAALPLGAWIVISGDGREPLAAPPSPELVVLLSDDTVDATTAIASATPRTERVVVPTSVRAAVDIELILDGKPAAGAPVSIERVAELDLFVTVVEDAYGIRREFEIPVTATTGRRESRTGADGAIRFEPGVGRYLVRVPGNGAVLELEPEQPRQIRFDLTGSATAVHCQVVDASGAPCVAEIWASRGVGDSALSPLAATDSSGVFRSVLPRGAVVQARTQERASESIQAMDGSPDLVLQLLPAGRLRGEIRGSDGRGLDGAIVEVEDGRSAMRVRTGAGGRFDIPGVRAGPWRLVARGGREPIGFGQTSVEVRAGATTDVHVDLLDAATVVGRVTDPHGGPIAHTRVRVGWSDERLTSVCTVTDEDGQFELNGVPPRTTRIEAGLGHDGHAHRGIAPRPGQTLTWNPVLSPEDLSVGGAVELPPDAPGLVVAFDTDDHFRPIARTAASERFSVGLPPSAAGRLLTARLFRAEVLEAFGPRRSFPIAVFRGVDPSDRDLSWRLESVDEQRGALHARVVVPAGSFSGPVRLMNLDLDHWVEVGAISATERSVDIHAERLPAGRYSLGLERVPGAVEFDLSASEIVDLGDILLADPAHLSAPAVDLQLVFEHPGDATSMERLSIEVDSLDGTSLARAVSPGRNGAWRARVRVPPGQARVVARTDGGLEAEAVITVAFGGDTTFRIPLRH